MLRSNLEGAKPQVVGMGVQLPSEFPDNPYLRPRAVKALVMMVGDGHTSGTPTTHYWARDLGAGHLEEIPPGVGRLCSVWGPALGARGARLCGGRGGICRAGEGGRHRARRWFGADRGQGAGTDARVDMPGRKVKKPVTVTKDLRFFDFPQGAMLPDWHPTAGYGGRHGAECLAGEHEPAPRRGPGPSAVSAASRSLASTLIPWRWRDRGDLALPPACSPRPGDRAGGRWRVRGAPAAARE